MSDNILRLDTGVKRIVINVDDERTHTLTFNPHDVSFLERGHQIYRDALEKSEQLKAQKMPELELDENGAPVDFAPGAELIRETNAWFREQIDAWLGAGTCQAVFGDTQFADEKLNVYAQLVEGVMKIVQPERSAKIAQYVAEPQKGKPRKRG